MPIPDILAETIVLAEKILHWEFDATSDQTALPGVAAPGSEKEDLDSDQIDIRRTFTLFPTSWRPLIGNRDVIWLFFSAYMLLQSDDRLAHRLRQCLIQLSGQSPKFFENNQEAMNDYINAMVQGIVKCLNE